MLTNDELNLLESAKSEQDWSSACDLIKNNHGGYPSDWYEKVLASGLARRVLNSFGSTDELRVVPIRF